MALPPLAMCEACERRFRIVVEVRGKDVTYKCAYCHKVTHASRPNLNKKVIYLDQFVISNVFKIKEKLIDEASHHHDFWQEVSELLEKCILLQQVVCPSSNIHRDETMLFPSHPSELALFHEMLSGDTSFKSTSEIELDQIWAYLEAFSSGKEPDIDLSVDEILQGSRNKWLSSFHITVKPDWSVFAPTVRAERDRSSLEFSPLYNSWRSNPKTDFKSVLKNEIEGFGAAKIGAYQHFVELFKSARVENDIEAMGNIVQSPIFREFREIRDYFIGNGLDMHAAEKEVIRFWSWTRNFDIPHHRIQSYLYAALARKTKSAKDNPNKGTGNDIRAIATYAPYVDAMMIDKEFARFLNEGPLKGELSYRAKIFSLGNKQEFLDYLRVLIADVSYETEMIAVALYGDRARRTA